MTLKKSAEQTSTDKQQVARSDAVKELNSYIRSNKKYVHHQNGRCYFNISYFNPKYRRYLESIGELKRAGTKSELIKDGVNVTAGFHGRYLFHETNEELVGD